MSKPNPVQQALATLEDPEVLKQRRQLEAPDAVLMAQITQTAWRL